MGLFGHYLVTEGPKRMELKTGIPCSQNPSSSMSSAKPKNSEELSKEVRLDLAIDEYKQAFLVYHMSFESMKKKRKPSIRSIAKQYGLIYTTLKRRIIGKTQSRQEAHESEQRLSDLEENTLKAWILQVAEWGWPPRISQIKFMTSELLMNKGDYRELGPNWVSRFLSRYSKLRSRFSQPLDRDRAETHDSKKLMRWFQLVKSTIQKYSIQQKDVYNMDEKGFAIGAAERFRVVCYKSNLQIYKT